jgi:kynurenine aminotransferase
MLSAFMGFIETGDEVIIFEPFFDQYLSPIGPSTGMYLSRPSTTRPK